MVQKKWNPPTTLVGMQTVAATMENSMEVPLKSEKKELPYDPAIQLLGLYSEKTIIQKDTQTPMLIAVLFIIAKTWKQLKFPSTDEWVKKMWYVYTMEYYLAIKRMK